MILAIETSCDDSAVAIMDQQGKIVANEISSQIDEHSLYGGVVPEIASRSHLKTLPSLAKFTLKKSGIAKEDLSSIAVTYAPGLVGSLLVGLNYAKSMAWSLDIPFYAVDHLEGHLLAPFLDNPDLEFPFLALIASGGHTHLVYAKGLNDYTLVGKTLDDAVGEAFDKAAKMLGLSYPGGPIIDKISQTCSNPDIEFPIPLLGQKEFNFSYSGLKTALRNMAIKEDLLTDGDLINWEQFQELEETPKKEKLRNIVASFQRTLVKTLIKTIDRAMKKYKVKNICVTGGVAANSELRKELDKLAGKHQAKAFYPQLMHCTDNAAMIAYVCWAYQQKGLLNKDVDWALNASSKSPLNSMKVSSN